MSPMRLVLLADHFLRDPSTPVTGTHVQMYNLAVGLSKRGADVHYVCRTNSGDRGVKSVDGVTVHYLPPARGPIAWITDLRHYTAILEQVWPDAVYQRGRSHLTYLAARWARANGRVFVWGSNGEDSCDFWKETNRLRRSARSLWRKTALFPSMWIQDLLIHGGVRGASFVVNQTDGQKERLWRNYRKVGIVLPSYYPAQEEAPSPKERVVLWLANWTAGKQPELFLKLAEQFRSDPKWSFVLAGGTDDRSYLERIRQLASGHPNVRLTGKVAFEATDDLFARAALFVSTSVAEGISNTFLQSWLRATPVLSLHHDPNGWIAAHGLGSCARGDWNRFLEMAERVLSDDDLRQEMGQRAGRFAREILSADRTITAYLRLFSGAVQGGGELAGSASAPKNS